MTNEYIYFLIDHSQVSVSDNQEDPAPLEKQFSRRSLRGQRRSRQTFLAEQRDKQSLDGSAANMVLFHSPSHPLSVAVNTSIITLARCLYQCILGNVE